MAKRKLILKTDWQDKLTRMAAERGWSSEGPLTKDLITDHVPNGNQWLTQIEFQEWCEYIMERYVEQTEATLEDNLEDCEEYWNWVNNREYF